MNEENGSTNEREKRKHIILPLFLVKRRKRERSERMMNERAMRFQGYRHLNVGLGSGVGRGMNGKTKDKCNEE